MNNKQKSRNMFSSSSVFIMIAIVAVLAVNAAVVSAMNNPFSKMNSIDVSNLQKAQTSQSDISTSDLSNINAVSSSDTVSDGDLIYPEYPYFIEVDKTNQIITIYTTSSSGKYDKVVRYMLCSTAQDASKFPEGYWKLKEDRCSSQNIWRNMKSHGTPLYAQYATQITGDYLFHSVPYTDTKNNALDTTRYSKLGTADSGGCIRLTVENAKWICENCKAGTTVHIVEKEANPALTAALKEQVPIPDSSGWDPTDPDSDNPNYQPQYTEADPEPEGYLVDNLGLDDITYSKEIPYVS